jgi:pilus assembly protein CpaE
VGELSFLVFSESESAREAICRSLRAGAHARVEAVVSDPEALARDLRSRRVEALFVSLGKDPERILGFVERLPAPRPLLLLSGPREDSGILLRAMRLGAKEFFPPEPSDDEVSAGIERLLLDHEVLPGRERSPAPVISVLGAKGGLGATTVACQLAVALHRHGASAIVDLDLAAGDVALYLDASPAHTLAELTEETDEIDATYVRMLLHPHATGVQILASPERIEEGGLASLRNLGRVVEILREEFDWVVFGLPRSLGEWTLRALDLSDQILLVTALDVPTLHHTRRRRELLERLGHGGKVRLVANRAGAADPLTEKDLRRFLKRGVDARLPNDFHVATACIEKGKPVGQIAGGSELDRAYRELAVRMHEWCGVPLRSDPRPAGRIRRWIGKLEDLRKRRRRIHGSA